MKVIKLSDGGKSARSIATEFGAGKTQIQNVFKFKEEIFTQFVGRCLISKDFGMYARIFDLVKENELVHIAMDKHILW